MLFIFSKFKLRKWKKYSAEKRFNVLRALEKRIARWLEIDPIKLELKEDATTGTATVPSLLWVKKRLSTSMTT